MMKVVSDIEDKRAAFALRIKPSPPLQPPVFLKLAEVAAAQVLQPSPSATASPPTTPPQAFFSTHSFPAQSRNCFRQKHGRQCLTLEMALPSSIGGWDWLVARGYSTIDSNKFYESDYHANYMAWYQIMALP
jgi:hypothetical protein